jgi:6-phosphogluconate dehydrogenase
MSQQELLKRVVLALEQKGIAYIGIGITGGL